MVGIDVLDVPGAIDADAGGQVDCMMLDTELASSGSERSAAIGAQNQVGRHEGLQGRRQGGPPRQNSCRPDRIDEQGAMMEERIGSIRTGIQG